MAGVVVVGASAIVPWAAATVVSTAPGSVATTSPSRPTVLAGNFAGGANTSTDIALVGGGLATQPVAKTNGDGTFTVTNLGDGWFAGLMNAPGIKVVNGDFNHDGNTDIALIGGTGWHTIPVALSQGNGGWTIKNPEAPDFGGWGQAPTSHPVTGDFNHDGNTDIALVGGQGWTTIPVAMSKGDGTFTITNSVTDSFPGWSQGDHVYPFARDFNGDGRTDLALVGNIAWTTLPVALSNGDGSFTVVNGAAKGTQRARLDLGDSIFVGDVDGDHKDDILNINEHYIRWVSAKGDGTWRSFDTTLLGPGVREWHDWAFAPGVQRLGGDFDGDGRLDVALTGVSGWSTIPMLRFVDNATVAVTNLPVDYFPGWAITTQQGASVIAGNFNSDNKTDLALVGGCEWTTIPVALSNGDGSFVVTNNAGGFVSQRAQAGCPATGPTGGGGGGGGGSTEQIPVNLSKDQVTSGPVPYRALFPPFGSVPPGRLLQIQIPQSSPADAIKFVKVGHSTAECNSNSDAVVQLNRGQTSTPDQISAIYGTAQPSYSTTNPLGFVACVVNSGPILGFVQINITVQH